MSNLENLSPVDFEDLCRDLAQAETGHRFSAFGPGPDGGIDGRHSKASETTILQCKHYVGSSFSALKKAAIKEVEKIHKLAPKRYLFFTSQSLTPKKSEELANILGSLLEQPEDVWGREDIESALRRNPEIEKSHTKLWLSSTAVLEKVLHSGLENFTQATKNEILEELKVYVRNPSFDSAIEILEGEHVLIVSGAPGVGKTTLAKMLSYHYLNDGWRFSAINSLEEVFAQIDDEVPTVFFFDDFLGRIELDRQSLLQSDTAFSVFVKKVKKSKNAKFILTTRAHIFEEARRLSDHIDDRRLQLAKYLLDVGIYTRRIKSHIFFNHLLVSGLKQQHFSSLLKDSWLARIVDHENYNPRIIASVSSECLDDIEPEKYPQYIYHALEKPDLVWSKPFNSLDVKSQNLLLALFFGDSYRQIIDVLRDDYAELHRIVCSFYSQPAKPNDFEEALRSLESGFISISASSVSFVNPSLSDYLKSYLINKELLCLLIQAVRRPIWANNLWQHIKVIFKNNDEDKKYFASKFRDFSRNIDSTPTMGCSKDTGEIYITQADLSLSDRVEMLFEWWEYTRDDFFLIRAINLLESTSLELNSWDGMFLPELHRRADNFIDDDQHLKSSLLYAVENKIKAVIDAVIYLEDLVDIVKSVNEFMPSDVPRHFDDALYQAIQALDAETEQSEYLHYLDTFAKEIGKYPAYEEELVNDHIAVDKEQLLPQKETSFALARHNIDHEEFSNDDITSLFYNLINNL